MGKHLLSAFAADDPERFARFLGESGSVEETVAILAEIPAGLECDVVARLVPSAAERLLSNLPVEVVAAWLMAGPVDAGRRLLTRMSHVRAEAALAGVTSQSKRRKLRRLLTFPQGSVGELTQVKMLAVKGSAPAAEVSEHMQNSGEELEGPVVILHDNGQVMGVLDPVRFIQNLDPAATAADFCITVKPVFAEASLESLRGREEWSVQTSLPVVDFESQVVGYVTRSAMEKAISSRSESSLFLESLIELSKRFLEFLVHVVTIVLDRRAPR